MIGHGGLLRAFSFARPIIGLGRRFIIPKVNYSEIVTLLYLTSSSLAQISAIKLAVNRVVQQKVSGGPGSRSLA